MKTACVLLIVLCLASASSVLARPAGQRNVTQAPGPGELWNDAPRARGDARADTVWFGGYNEAEGIAYNSVDDGYDTAVWTWDAGTADSLEGWTSRDLTTDLRTYFSRVVADSFISHGDPGIPMFPAPSTAQIWVGMHEDEADDLDWQLGMGYGNDMCQKAISPQYDITAGEDIEIGFKYFQDSEIDFDYTYVHILTYDAEGTLLQTYEVDHLDAKIGTAEAPADFGPVTVPYSSFYVPPAKVRLQFNFDADGGWSDEDGDYSCDYGPFAADDVHFKIGTTDHSYDFESDEEGWTFEICPGVGSYMNVCSEADWSTWVLSLRDIRCPCDLSGNALYCATDIVTSEWPGHFPGHDELLVSPIIDRDRFTAEDGWRTVFIRFDAFEYLRYASLVFYRPRFSYYPYTTPENPRPRWSPPMGQNRGFYPGTTPLCAHNRVFSLTAPIDGTALPYDWQRLRCSIEVYTDECISWCPHVGKTRGSPVYDNVRLGLTSGVDAPAIALQTGHLFHDGFGQELPEFLDPGDVCDANVAYDWSRDNTETNDWLADTALVRGPVVGQPDETYWIDLCFKVAKKGPRQDWIPAYSVWKARLPGDPEADFVCALMDTAMIPSAPYPVPVDDGQARVTYFHEDDPGFDPGHPRFAPEQEILPDRIFTPGTRVEYYYRSYWAQNPAGYFTLPAGAPSQSYEMEFLPMMELDTASPGEYDVIWPSVLYVDAFNAGAEGLIMPMLEQAGVAFDKYDRLEFASNYDAPMLRSFGGEFYNPGDYGNNGCTLEQLLGYRLILWNTGSYGLGAGEVNDFVLLENWLTSVECGLPTIRRGLVMNGNEVASLMADPAEGKAILFCNDILGVTLTDHAYRDYNNDDYGCVSLPGATDNEFDPLNPIAVYGNGCPRAYNYNVLGLQPGAGAEGNLDFQAGAGASGYIFPLIHFSQVVKEENVTGGGGWKTAVDGFSWHHLSEVDYGGTECSNDSLAVLAGMADLIGSELVWLADDGAMPFTKWSLGCGSVVDDDSETHLSGPVDFLYPSRPNPFRGSATIRFSLAKEGPVEIVIYDVTGRRVRTLHDGKAPVGESTMIWDGTDDAGHRVGSGIFWVELSTEGYRSTKRLVTLH